jgi:ATP-dependent Lhr-like helicase
MKKAIDARTVRLLCMSCGKWIGEEKIRSLPEHPVCNNCDSKLLAPLYFSQDAAHVQEVLQKRQQGKELAETELKELTNARRMADLVLSYGKQAVVALEVKGVGPETASRILGKMHPKEDEFYMDLLKAKIQYLRTREFWEDKEDKKRSY